MTNPQPDPRRAPALAPLIVYREDLTQPGSTGGRRPMDQAATAVYAKRDNTFVPLGRSLRPMEHTFSGYKVRCDVSLAEHEFNNVDISSALHSANDALTFTGRISFGFRVHNPVEIVRRDITDGYERVLSRLRDRLVMISSRYTIEEYAQAQQDMNRTLGGSPLVLDEGITIYRFFAHIVRDATTLEAAKMADAALRQVVVVKAEHVLNTTTQSNKHALEQQEMTAVGQALQGDYGPLRLILARNPDNVLGIISALSESRQASAQQRLDVLKHMMDNNLMQDVDIAEYREQLVAQVMAAGRGTTIGLDAALGGATQHAALPPAPVPAPAGGHRVVESVLVDSGSTGTAGQAAAHPAAPAGARGDNVVGSRPRRGAQPTAPDGSQR
ncbi:hypothetical protein [Longispora urticae]